MNWTDIFGVPQITRAESDAMVFGVIMGAALGILVSALLNCLRGKSDNQ